MGVALALTDPWRQGPIVALVCIAVSFVAIALSVFILRSGRPMEPKVPTPTPSLPSLATQQIDTYNTLMKSSSFKRTDVRLSTVTLNDTEKGFKTQGTGPHSTQQ